MSPALLVSYIPLEHSCFKFKSMKILVLASYPKSLVSFRGPLLKELVSRGHSVHATAPYDKNTPDVIRQLEDFGVSFSSLSLSRHSINPIKDLYYIFRLLAFALSYRPDCVLAYTVKPVIYSGLSIFLYRLFCPESFVKHVSLITGLGYAFTTDTSSLYGQLIRQILLFLYRVSLRNSNDVVFQNPDDLSDFKSLGLISKYSHLHRVWGSGVDLARFAPQPLPSHQSFLMLSRLLVHKGIREYLRAAQIVKAQYPSVNFYLAGMLDSNPASINPHELEYSISRDIIIYLGELASVNSILKSCRYFVLPSYREGTPRSVLEAMATSRPILTTDVPGCRETVIDGRNGFIVPVRDSDALALSMIRLIKQSDEETKKMAVSSLQLARQYYDVRKVNAEIIEIMDA